MSDLVGNHFVGFPRRWLIWFPASRTNEDKVSCYNRRVIIVINPLKEWAWKPCLLLFV